MKTIVGFIFCLVASSLLCYFKFWFYTWQFWTIAIPILGIYLFFIEDKIFKK